MEQRQREISGQYAKFYPAIAVTGLALTFFPIVGELVADGLRSRAASLWELAGGRNGESAILGVALMLALVVMLAVATVRVPTPVLPGAMAGVAALIVLMLLTRPGFGEHTPPLAPAGLASVVLSSCVIVLGIAHAVHLARMAAHAR